MEFEYLISNELIDYQQALTIMNIRREKLYNGNEKSLFWLLEHTDIYTAGRSAKNHDLLDKNAKVIEVDRGGKYTYHGPGQCIGYIVTDLKKFNNGVLDVRKFINNIEQIIIETLLEFNIESFADRENVGIWVQQGDKKFKIAAIGIKISKMITTHGFAINVNTDLSKFRSIIPCGITNHGVCSMNLLGVNTSVKNVQSVVIKKFAKIMR